MSTYYHSTTNNAEEHIVIPDFPALCPFTPSPPSQLYRSVFPSEWLSSLKQARSRSRSRRSTTPNSIRHRTSDSTADRFGLLAALCYPDAKSADRLWVCAQLLALVHRICDVADSLSPTGDDSDEEWMGLRVVRVMQGVEKAGKGDGSWCRAWNGLRLTSPTHLAQCILHAITGLVAARTHQIRLSGGGVVPDVESYVQWRREAGVAEMAFALIPYAYGLDFDPELEMEIELREMTGLAGDLISWSTDVYAYNTSRPTSNFHNLVSVLSFSTNSPHPQESIDQIEALFAQTMNEFSEVKERVRELHDLDGFQGGMDVLDSPEVYVKGLEDCIAGFLHWSFETRRHFGAERRKVKKRRVLRLLLAMFA